MEYNTVEHLEFQFISDTNQIVELGNLSGLALAVGLKQNKPSYDLLALSRDYTIEDNVLKFNLNCYTTNWLREVNKNNTEAYIEISQESISAKQVLLRDYCYVWPRTLIDGLSPEEIQSNNYFTKSETQEYVENAIEGISGFVTEEQFEEGLATKQNVIDDENKLAYELLSGTPTIPTKTSDLENDSDFITSGYVDDGLATKQDEITVDNKLDYALLSGTPTIPTKTSDLTNDSDFVTSSYVDNAVSGLASESYVDNALSGKQDVIDDMNWLPASLVRMDIDHWQGDPDFDVESAVNMTRDDVYAVSGVVSGLVSSKLDKSDYVAPYRLPYSAGPNSWLEEDIGVTLAWSDQDIIPNDRKIVVVAYSDNGDDHLVFPTLIAHADENVIKTCEVWVKMAGNTTEAQGIAAIVVPSSYYIVDESNFPTKLKGEATNNEAYTYHVFVIRAVPRQGASLCEVSYSHFINTNLSI